MIHLIFLDQISKLQKSPILYGWAESLTVFSGIFTVVHRFERFIAIADHQVIE